jgi:hypothetical protein
MDTVAIVIVVVVVLAVIAVGVAVVGYRRRRSHQLEQRFGPEYERTVEGAGGRRAAESELKGREKRRSQFNVTPLTSESADRYREEWNSLQQRFVDEPGTSVEQADRLVVRIMRECGYPVDDFDQRADDISVDHPDVAQNYRDAHRVAVAQAEGQADTEQLRQALTSYRRLVDELLGEKGAANQSHPSGPTDNRERT